MDDLIDQPQKYSFYQAIRLLQLQALRKQNQTRRTRRATTRAIGEDAIPADEILQLKVSQSLNSQPSEIQAVKQIHAEGMPDKFELTATMMGITGVHGTLPHHYTSLIMSRMRAKDFALRDFLDLFNHRLLSFFFKAWEKKHLPAMLERESLQGKSSSQSIYRQAFYSMLGRGTGGLLDRQANSDQLFLAYAGLFLGKSRPADGLERLLKNYFKIPVEIEQFSGRWLNLQPENRSRLPGSEQPKGQFNSIGHGVILGRRVWDVQSKIRLIVGPVRQDHFRRYLPDGDLLKPICEVTRSYLGPGLAFDLLLKVDRPEVEPTRLVSGEGKKYRLGWNSWLKADSKTTGISEVVFSAGME